jgi:hypothetical protein
MGEMTQAGRLSPEGDAQVATDYLWGEQLVVEDRRVFNTPSLARWAPIRNSECTVSGTLEA